MAKMAKEGSKAHETDKRDTAEDKKDKGKGKSGHATAKKKR